MCLVAEAAWEIYFRTSLLLHPQGRRKGDLKHKMLWAQKWAGHLFFVLNEVVQRTGGIKGKTQLLLFV